jgi:ABC-type multidrug transport system permease subunit
MESSLAIGIIAMMAIVLIGGVAFAKISESSIATAENNENLEAENTTAHGIEDVGGTIISVLPWVALFGLVGFFIYWTQKR